MDPDNSGLHIHGQRIQVAQTSGNASDHFIFYGNVFGLDFQFADLLHQAVDGILGLTKHKALPKELFIIILHLGKNTLQPFCIAGMAFYGFLILLDTVIATVKFPQGVFHNPDFYGGRSHKFFHADNVLHLNRNAIEYMFKPIDIVIRRLEQFTFFAKFFDFGIHVPNQGIQAACILICFYDNQLLLAKAFSLAVNMLVEQMESIQLPFQGVVIGI